MKKVLITGGAGFIGYHLAQWLSDMPNTSVTLVDNLQRGKLDQDFANLLQKGNITFLQADLTDQLTYQKLDQDFNQVYHLAAVNGTKLFYEIPHEVLRINILSLFYLLEWVKGLPSKPKICFTSSNEAYAGALASFGQLPIPTPENVPLVISDTYNPRWSYGGSKLIGEQIIINYALAYDIPGVIVRPHNFYGPRAGYNHVIPEFCQKILDHQDPFTIFSPDETRTFCYITDAVQAMQMLMDSLKTNHQPIETVHIGATDEITMGDLANRFFEIVGWRPSQMHIEPSPAGSVKRRLADIRKIQQLISWQPKTILDEGLKQTFEWYKHNPKQA